MAKIICMSAADIAWKKMVALLFKPFCFTKWFYLGFCVWMATLLDGSSNFYNYRVPQKNEKNESSREFINALDRIFNGESGTFLSRSSAELKIPEQYITLIIASIIIFLVILLLITVILIWFRSRFKLILLDNLIHDQTEIISAWRKFRAGGNNIFSWYIILGVIAILLYSVCFIVAAFGFIPWFRACLFNHKLLTPEAFHIFLMATAMSFMCIITIAFALINFIFDELVIPVIYWTGSSVMPAWVKIGILLRANLGSFCRYLCLYLIFSIIAGSAIILAGLLTCCLGLLLLLIPIIGTVIILPVPVFFKFFSLEFLAAMDNSMQLTTNNAALDIELMH
jgi:hypothetical protein